MTSTLNLILVYYFCICKFNDTAKNVYLRIYSIRKSLYSGLRKLLKIIRNRFRKLAGAKGICLYKCFFKSERRAKNLTGGGNHLYFIPLIRHFLKRSLRDSNCKLQTSESIIPQSYYLPLTEKMRFGLFWSMAGGCITFTSESISDIGQMLSGLFRSMAGDDIASTYVFISVIDRTDPFRILSVNCQAHSIVSSKFHCQFHYCNI